MVAVVCDSLTIASVTDASGVCFQCITTMMIIDFRLVATSSTRTIYLQMVPLLGAITLQMVSINPVAIVPFYSTSPITAIAAPSNSRQQYMVKWYQYLVNTSH